MTGREQDANLYDPQREKHVLNQSAVTLHRKCIIKDFISSSDDDDEKNNTVAGERITAGVIFCLFTQYVLTELSGLWLDVTSDGSNVERMLAG